MTIARTAMSTVTFVDEYCVQDQDVFPDGRSDEHFVRFHLGLLAELPRKTLPAMAKAVNGTAQALHHLLAYAPWAVTALRQRRQALLTQALHGRAFVLGLMRRVIALDLAPLHAALPDPPLVTGLRYSRPPGRVSAPDRLDEPLPCFPPT